MSLPTVVVHAAAGDAPTVTVDGVELPAVRSAQVTVTADGIPQVSLVLAANNVTVELPAGVSVLRAGPSAAEFVATLKGRLIEQEVVDTGDLGTSFGDGVVGVLVRKAAEFDGRR